MEWFIAVLAVTALGVAAMAAAGGMGQMSDDPVRDTFAPTLPDRPLTASDLQDLRLGVTLRGYSMSQVDDLLDRLAAEIEARDVEIAQLRGAPFPEPVEGRELITPVPEPAEGPEPVAPFPEHVEGPERAETPGVRP